MLFSILKEKYKVHERELKILNDCMANNSSLEETTGLMNNSITDREDGISLDINQVFALASALCKELFEEPIADIAPQIAMDKRALNEVREEGWQEDKAKRRKRERMEAIKEDLALYAQEQKLKKQT